MQAYYICLTDELLNTLVLLIVRREKDLEIPTPPGDVWTQQVKRHCNENTELSVKTATNLCKISKCIT